MVVGRLLPWLGHEPPIPGLVRRGLDFTQTSRHHVFTIRYRLNLASRSPSACSGVARRIRRLPRKRLNGSPEPAPQPSAMRRPGPPADGSGRHPSRQPDQQQGQPAP